MSTNQTDRDGAAPEREAATDSKRHAVNTLAATLFGKTRLQILTLLHGRPGERFYLRQLTSAAGVAVGAAQRELAELTAAGIVRRVVEGRQVYFQANPACPVFAELQSILKKTGRTDVTPATIGPSLTATASPTAPPAPTRPKPAPLPPRPASARVAAPPNPAFVWMTRR